MFWAELHQWRKRAVANPLATAFCISLALHLSAFGLYHLGKQLGWKEPAFLTALRQMLDQKMMAVMKPARINTLIPEPNRPQPEDIPVPLSFVDVDPTTVVQDAPKDAKFYSSASTRAANPDPQRDTPVPKIDGKQTQIVRTFDSPKTSEQLAPPQPKPEPKAEPLQPTEQPKQMAKAQPKVEIVRPSEPKPKRAETEGNTTLAKAVPQPRESDGKADTKQGDANVLTKPAETAEPKQSRPRTLAEARAAKGLPPAERMRQEGGVQRADIKTSLNVMATAYGDYDAQIINAIRSRWYALLEGRHSPVGKVVVEFKLHSNGKISELRTSDSSVDSFFQLLCEAAIDNNMVKDKEEKTIKGFDPWPPEMRRVLGSDVREVRFTFFYN